jgi:hypothetical protein
MPDLLTPQRVNGPGLPAQVDPKLIVVNRELQKRNQQAHHDWAKAHQHELQQLRVTVTQSTETILSSAGFQSHGQGLLTAAETDRLACGSKSLSANKAINKKEKSPFHSKRHMNLKARFRTPNWLFGVSHAIEIYESRANAGWAFNIQVYNVVPLESPIFNFAKKGDISGMKELFRTGQASPFDRNLYGRTLLDVR